MKHDEKRRTASRSESACRPSGGKTGYFDGPFNEWRPLVTFDVDDDLSVTIATPETDSPFRQESGRSFEDLLDLDPSSGERVFRWLGEKPFLAESLAWLRPEGQVRFSLHSPEASSGLDDLLRIATDLSRASGSELDRALAHSLRRIGRMADVDRAYVFITDGPDILTNTHEWARSGTDPQILVNMRVPMGPFRWFIERLEETGCVVLESLDDIPSSAGHAREFLESQGIRSLLAVGIFHDGRLEGFAGFDSVRKQKRWSNRKIEQLELIGGLFVQSVLHARSERELQQTHRQFELVVQNVSDLILLVSSDGTIRFASPSSVTLLGASSDELEGQSLFDLFSVEDRPHLERIMSTGAADPGSDERVTVRLNGQEPNGHLVEIVASPLENGDELDGLLLVARHLDDRDLLIRQMERSSRVASLGFLASAVAHEFNNVLMGAQPFIEILERSSDPERRSLAVQRIADALERGKGISREILRFARPVRAEIETIDLGEWMRRTEEELRRLVTSDIDLELDLEEEALVVAADPELLHQCLVNLTLNARKALESQGRGRITISARRSDDLDGAILEVRDNGPQLSEEAEEHLFDPMYMHRRNAGDGLGLSVVEKLTTAQGGRVGVESSPNGTVLWIFLRSSTASEDAVPDETSAPRQAHTGGPILLVEDDEIVASGITAMLELEGVEVEIVTSGEEAISRIRSDRPRIVILDIGLPDMSGLQVYETIEETWPDVPVIFSSGHGDQQKLEPVLARPNVEFLLKPYDSSTLLSVMKQHVNLGN